MGNVWVTIGFAVGILVGTKFLRPSDKIDEHDIVVRKAKPFSILVRNRSVIHDEWQRYYSNTRAAMN